MLTKTWEVRDGFLVYSHVCPYVFLKKTNRNWISKEETVLKRGVMDSQEWHYSQMKQYTGNKAQDNSFPLDK